LFYLTKDVRDGPPVTDCFTAAVEDLTDNCQAAIVFLATAALLLLAMLGSFPLCCTNAPEEEGTEADDRSMSRI
jgi:hypothetical protein